MGAEDKTGERKMTQRTDPHRPGAIIPADYDYRVSYQLATSMEGWPVPAWNVDRVLELHREAHARGNRVFGGPGKCGACGAVYTYGDVWEHRPTGELLHVGHICADKYSMMADRSEFELEMGRRKQAAAVEVAKAYARERRAAVYAENPGLEEALELDHPILRDLASKVGGRYGLSVNQIKLALKIADEVRNPKPEEAKVNAPEGKVDFDGEIVSIKHQEGDWGTSVKMTVKVTTEAGVWLAWGTCPAMILDQVQKFSVVNGGYFSMMRGLRVELRATLKRGRDPFFAIMSRPSGRLAPEALEALEARERALEVEREAAAAALLAKLQAEIAENQASA